MVPKTTSVVFFQCSIIALVHCIHWYGYFGMVETSRPALILEALTRNIRVPYFVTLLPYHHGRGNLSLGIFGCLEKVAIMSVGFVLYLFKYFCHILFRKW